MTTFWRGSITGREINFIVTTAAETAPRETIECSLVEDLTSCEADIQSETDVRQREILICKRQFLSYSLERVRKGFKPRPLRLALDDQQKPRTFPNGLR
jgi:hypothetical protein